MADLGMVNAETPATPPVGDRAKMKISLGMGSIFEDPISFEIMENAVITPCGHSFSQVTLDDWLTTSATCPLCTAALNKSDVVPNFSLREAINKYEALKHTLSYSSAVVEANSKDISGSSSSDTSASPDCHRFDLTSIIKPSEENNLPSVEDFEIPKVIVEIVEAENLAEKGDTYVVAEFQDVKKMTAISKANPNPQWEESLIFNVDVDEVVSANLALSVFRKGVLHQHFLGKVDIPFGTLRARRKLSGWYILEKKNASQKKPTTGRLNIRVSLLGNVEV